MGQQIESPGLLIRIRLDEDLRDLISPSSLEKELHDHQPGILLVDRIEHIQRIQHPCPPVRRLVVQKIHPRPVIRVIRVMHQRILAIGQVLDKPITVEDAIERLPTADLPAVRRIIYDI